MLTLVCVLTLTLFALLAWGLLLDYRRNPILRLWFRVLVFLLSSAGALALLGGLLHVSLDS